MPAGAGEYDEAIAAVSAEPGVGHLVGPSTAVLLLALDGSRVLWVSGRGGELATRLAGPDRTVPAGALRTQLAQLASRLAPNGRFRLERLRLGAGRLDPAQTWACRRLSLPSGDVLLLAALLGHSLEAHEAAAPVAKPERPADADAPPPETLPLASLPEPSPEAGDAPRPARPPTARRSGGRRFLWRTDADGRFLSVSPELAAAVGTGTSAIVGRVWRDLEGRVVLDEAGRVADALAGRTAWNRLPALWRETGSGRLVPVELSGAPILSPSGGRAGARGFGVAYPDEAKPAPAGTWRAEPVPAGAPGRTAEPVGKALDQALHAAAAFTGTAGDTVFGVLRAWFTPHLGQMPTMLPARRDPAAERIQDGPAITASPVREASLPPPTEPETPAGLTASERIALHEIARALGGGETETERDDREGRTSAKIVPLPVRPREADPARILDRLPIGIAVLRDEVPIYVNPALLALAGEADMPSLVARGGLPALFGFDPRTADPEGRFSRASGTTPEGRPVEFEASAVTWGEMPATLVAATPAPAAAPTPAPASGDTERERALDLELAALRLQEKEVSTALELAADGVVGVDDSGRIRSMNDAAERLFGYSRNEFVGDVVTALFAPEDHRALLSCLTIVRSDPAGRLEERELRTRTRDGRSTPLSMRAGLVERDEGPIFLLALRDISRFRVLEEKLRVAHRAAELASTNRADFLARISHEIRTPLTAITGFAELMLQERFGVIGNERYKGYVRDIHHSGEHVLSLVNDLLDLAKATAGRADLHPVEFDLREIAQGCVALAAPLAARARTIVRTSFAPGLGRVEADERSVRQIVLNVLSNAIKFTGAGGQVILSTAGGGPGEAVLRVRDTGPGMSQVEIEDALMPFRQVAATRRGDGTGLGLPLSKALTEANGGVFAISSSRHGGTLVEIRLPLADAEAPGSLAAE